MEKGVWRSIGAISRMDSPGGILYMSEFNLEKSSGLKEQTLIIDKDGSPKTTDEFGHIPAYQNSVKVGQKPYFLEISEIREIIYAPE